MEMKFYEDVSVIFRISYDFVQQYNAIRLSTLFSKTSS